MKNLKKKSKSKKRQIEEEGGHNVKKRKLKQDQGESATKQAKVLQHDVSKEGSSICLKVETSDPKVNVTREEDVIEIATADDAGAEKVEGERELSPVLEKDVVVSISDDEEVLYISDEDSEELEGTALAADPPPLDPSYGSAQR